MDEAIENDDDDDAFAGVSDIESSASNFDQEENVSSTVAAINTATTLSTSSTMLSFGDNTDLPATLSMDVRATRSTSPNEWSVEDVIEFIAETDPALSVHAELFRKHVSFSSLF